MELITLQNIVLLYLKPTPRAPNQSGTIGEGALLVERFLSAECVR